jgi:hypothetical protein
METLMVFDEACRAYVHINLHLEVVNYLPKSLGGESEINTKSLAPYSSPPNIMTPCWRVQIKCVDVYVDPSPSGRAMP